MTGYLERLAVWYLARRGVCVLPRAFVGLAIGHAQAVKMGGDGDFDSWEVSIPRGFPPIALNHSQIIHPQGRGWDAIAKD